VSIKVIATLFQTSRLILGASAK